MRADPKKSLAEIGVSPGWFCQHSGCSIWLEIVRVYDTAIICVSRDPSKETDYVHHSDNWGSLWYLSKELPQGHIIFKDRKKNFYDKFHPEGYKSPLEFIKYS